MAFASCFQYHIVPYRFGSTHVQRRNTDDSSSSLYSLRLSFQDKQKKYNLKTHRRMHSAERMELIYYVYHRVHTDSELLRCSGNGDNRSAGSSPHRTPLPGYGLWKSLCGYLQHGVYAFCRIAPVYNEFRRTIKRLPRYHRITLFCPTILENAPNPYKRVHIFIRKDRKNK